MEKPKEKSDRIYDGNRDVYYDGEPDTLAEGVLKYKEGGSVLELGAGQGRNALFLASRGFDVTAVDISSRGIANLEEKAKEMGVEVKTQIEDLQNFKFEGNFDSIISTYVFHFLSPEAALRVIRSAQDHTAMGGLNAMALLTKEGDFYHKNPTQDRFYSDPGELKDLYKGWEILEYSEVETPLNQRQPDGGPIMNVIAKILARKI